MRRLLVLALACSSAAPPPPAAPVAIAPAAPGKLLPVSAFDVIADREARSRAIFAEISRVLMSPRCVNCHPTDDSPRQRDAHELHDPPVVRGGVPAMQCETCHQDKNAELARVPGAPGWKLAPLTMAWLGKSAGQICEQIKDSSRNGARSLVQIHEHLVHDALVAWGWAPGADRTPAPGSQRELADLAGAWIDSGAECPPP